MKMKILGVFVVVSMLLSLIFIRNPLYVRSIDAVSDSTVNLEDIYSSVSPYVEIKHMNLKDSGYYTVTKDEKIRSHYYFGQIGERYCLIELSGKLLENYPKDSRNALEDVSLTLKLIKADPVIASAAESAGMSPEEYMSVNNIYSVAASEYQNNQMIVYIYYALALLLAIGIFYQMIIINKRNTKERQVEYEE